METASKLGSQWDLLLYSERHCNMMGFSVFALCKGGETLVGPYGQVKLAALAQSRSRLAQHRVSPRAAPDTFHPLNLGNCLLKPEHM